MHYRTANVHVIPNQKKGWDVKRSGAEYLSGQFEIKQDAIDYGRDISQKTNSELFVYNLDGKIAWRDSHGSDPYPPPS